MSRTLLVNWLNRIVSWSLSLIKWCSQTNNTIGLVAVFLKDFFWCAAFFKGSDFLNLIPLLVGLDFWSGFFSKRQNKVIFVIGLLNLRTWVTLKSSVIFLLALETSAASATSSCREKFDENFPKCKELSFDV